MKNFRTFGILLVAFLLAGSLSADTFNHLFRIMNPTGDCLVRLPTAKEGEQGAYVAAIKGKAYPYGTMVKVGADSSAAIMFDNISYIRLLANSSVQIVANPEVEDGKIVKFESGTMGTHFNPAVTNDDIIIETPLGVCRKVIGNNRLGLVYGKTDVSLTMRAETESQIGIFGAQFIIPQLRNGYGAKITTTLDNSYTRIDNLLGDYSIFINQGISIVPALLDAENPDLYSVPLVTKSVVNIWRKKTSGGTTVASALATSPDGRRRASLAFVVGNPALASSVFEASTNALAATSAEAASPDAAAGDTLGDFGTDFGADFGGEATAAPAAPAATEAAPAAADDSLDSLLF